MFFFAIILNSVSLASGCIVTTSSGTQFDFTSLGSDPYTYNDASGTFIYDFLFCGAEEDCNGPASMCMTSIYDKTILGTWSTATNWTGDVGEAQIRGVFWGSQLNCPGPRQTGVTFICSQVMYATFLSITETSSCTYEAFFKIPQKVCGFSSSPTPAPAFDTEQWQQQFVKVSALSLVCTCCCASCACLLRKRWYKLFPIYLDLVTEQSRLQSLSVCLLLLWVYLFVIAMTSAVLHLFNISDTILCNPVWFSLNLALVMIAMPGNAPSASILWTNIGVLATFFATITSVMQIILPGCNEDSFKFVNAALFCLLNFSTFFFVRVFVVSASI